MLPQEILFKEAYIITQYAKQLRDELDGLIDLIVDSVKSGKHLIICGVGKNSSIAQKMAATYSSIGIPSFYLDAYLALHGDLGMIIKDQLIIGLSKSGNTEELISTFEHAGKFGAKLASLTCNAESKINKLVSELNGITITLPCEFEADEHNLAPTCSSTLFLAVGDAIGCVASSKLGFKKKDFFERHPAGSLGKTLKEELGAK